MDQRTVAYQQFQMPTETGLFGPPWISPQQDVKLGTPRQ